MANEVQNISEDNGGRFYVSVKRDTSSPISHGFFSDTGFAGGADWATEIPNSDNIFYQGGTGGENFFVENPKAFIWALNDCGCDDVIKNSYNIAVDPNGATSLQIVNYNRDEYGEIIGGAEEKAVLENLTLGSNRVTVAVKNTPNEKITEPWQKIDVYVSENRKIVGDKLEVSLYFQDNAGNRDSNIKLTYAKGADGKYVETPEYAEIMVYNKSENKAVKVSFPIAYENGAYKEVGEDYVKTENVVLPSKEDGGFISLTGADKNHMDFLAVLNSPAPVTHAGGSGGQKVDFSKVLEIIKRDLLDDDLNDISPNANQVKTPKSNNGEIIKL